MAIYATQKFHHQSGGKPILTMKVRRTTELKNWILSFGRWLQVLKPVVPRTKRWPTCWATSFSPAATCLVIAVLGEITGTAATSCLLGLTLA